ncbi:MAG: helix-turn-helix domain-containing protein [Elusimicrobiota bacterium]
MLVLQRRGLKFREIAGILNRSPSTLSHKLKKE